MLNKVPKIAAATPENYKVGRSVLKNTEIRIIET
jgi:hypothetical protein